MNDIVKVNNESISVVVPVYNGESTVEELIFKLKKELYFLVGDSYEIILVNDGSKDQSWDTIKRNALDCNKVKAINLRKNYGQHNALMCGFKYSKSKYVVTIDDDLQNPPEEISRLYHKIIQGYDLVYGVPIEKKHSRYRNIGSKLVQTAFRKTFNMHVNPSAFRILRHEIVENVISYDKSFTYLDGVIAWYASKITCIEVKHFNRNYGQSGYSLKKLFVLSLNLMTNFSLAPLQISSLVGLFFSVVGFSLGLIFTIKKLLWGIPVSGFTSLFVAISIFSGTQLLTIGILGEYIGRIHLNVSNKPQYAVKEVFNEYKP